MESNYRGVSAGAVQTSSGFELLPEVNMPESSSKTLTKHICRFFSRLLFCFGGVFCFALVWGFVFFWFFSRWTATGFVFGLVLYFIPRVFILKKLAVVEVLSPKKDNFAV